MSNNKDQEIQPPVQSRVSGPKKRLDDLIKAKFLNCLAKNDGFIGISASECGFNSSSFYNEKHSDAEFSAAWDQIVANSLDLLEREGYKRALDGCEEHVWYQGQIVGSKQNKSDALLMWYINNKRGYTNKTDHRLGGLPGAPSLGMPVKNEFYPENLTHDELQQLSVLLEKASTPPADLKSKQPLLAQLPQTVSEDLPLGPTEPEL